jgi:hypothetical protein
MNIPFELQIGWRYTRAGRSGRRNGFISFISMVSMLGIALGVAALIIVLSVMNGFQKEVRDRMLSVISHVEIYQAQGEALADWQVTATEARRNEQVVGAAPFIATQALIARGDDMRGAVVRGISPADLHATPRHPLVVSVHAPLAGGVQIDLNLRRLAVQPNVREPHKRHGARQHVQVIRERRREELHRQPDALTRELVHGGRRQDAKRRLLERGHLAAGASGKSERVTVDPHHAAHGHGRSRPVRRPTVRQFVGRTPDAEVRVVNDEGNGGRTQGYVIHGQTEAQGSEHRASLHR